ncbi:hypothetical protein Agabi119p4_7631 [Agaricus bisporus var. burnettii]|uniref:J domain-containing protein n=1 Tax=Agaricus bisporus var. burnettii TaxID=192524 RepID=A0A8H7C8F6_AGABI|nr:hypothetical protein Agabi119p4_7631 [Agaricus bisporus var. burnettii]
MSLFANYHPQVQPPATRTHGKSPARVPGLGYILFPEPGSYQAFLDAPEKYDFDSINVASTSSENVRDRETEELRKEQEEDEERKWRAEQEEYEKRAKRRRELEAEEARKGEEGWVRSGGVLRDAEGNRDWARTQAIRDELKLRELEEQILDRWNKYEDNWSGLVSKLKNERVPASGTLLTFEDIPWPVKYSKESTIGIQDLTVKKVEEFLLESLTVRSVKTTKKDRVRSSLLRWHPDKLGSLFSQVKHEDTGRIEQGVRIVMECLQKLNE